MRITKGTRLGKFEVTSLLGRGGGGDVYLARDLELGREVAIKMLHLGPAGMENNLERIEREAQLLASLNHPHIGAIYGLGSEGDAHFLVLELVPGRTLDSWFARRRSLDEILVIFQQIAEGLECAHRRGVVHRDLKPSNIKITPAGIAKILDFGIAEVEDAEHHGAGDTLELPASPESQESESSTGEAPGQGSAGESAASMSSQAEGAMIGTLPYMSPEQIRGSRVDAQSDIWAFGCLLYEVLARSRAFPGESRADVLTAILGHEPDWERLPADLPTRLVRLVRRCLAREPHRRLHHIADARLELQDLLEPETSPPRKSGRGAALALLALSAVAALAFTALELFYRDEPMASSFAVHPRYFEIGLPGDAPVWLWWWRPVPALAISPDGNSIVYVAERGLGAQLYLKELNRKGARALDHTEDARNPFFSPDGRKVAFLTDEALKVIDLDSGRVSKLTDVTPESSGGSWGDDGSLYFTPNPASPVFRIGATGGMPESVTELDAAYQERAHLWPEILPGSETILFNTLSDAGLPASRLIAESLETGERQVVAEGGAHARFVPGTTPGTGRVVFADTGQLLSRPFDIAKRLPLGPTRTLLSGVRTEATGAGQYAISQEGTIVYVPGTAELGDRSLVWAEPGGSVQVIPAPRRNYRAPRLSPNRRRIAVEINDAGRFDIWVYDLERGTFSRLTFEGNNFSPIWSPDGKHVTYVSDRDGKFSVMKQPFDDSAPAQTLLTRDRSIIPSSWSPDGKRLAYYERHPERQLDIWIWSASEAESDLFLASSSSELKPMFSPDGNWIAFSSDRSGIREVYVARYPEGEPLTQISSEGGREPVWSPRGDALYFRNEGEVVRVEISYQSSMEVGDPAPVYPGTNKDSDYRWNALARPWASLMEMEGSEEEGLSRAAALPSVRIEPPPPGKNSPWVLQYVFPDRESLLAVDLLEGVRPRVSSPRPVFDAHDEGGSVNSEFDVDESGDRLLMVQGAAEQPIVDGLEVALGLLQPLTTASPDSERNN